MVNNFSLNINKKYSLFLVIVLLIGAVFRLTWLDKSPPSLNWDEAALGYNAYSLMKTGKDEFGHNFPIVLRSFDDYKPALYSYVAIPFIKAFGLNEIAVRLPSALAGVAIILLIYLIANHFFKERVAILAAALIAIEPWSIHFSRAAFEANLALAILLLGILLALKSTKKLSLFFLSLPVIILSAYTYHGNRVLLFPLILGVFWLLRKKFPKNRLYKLLITLVLLLILPLFSIIASGEGLARFSSTSIIKLWEGNETSLISLKENPIYSLGTNIIGRYLAYFSPANLFVRGSNEPTQQIPGFGPFYSVEFLFWLAGLFALARNKFKPKPFSFLLVLAPLPAIITWNWFYPSRTLLLFAMFSILTALGLDLLISYFRRQTRLLSIVALTSLFLLLITSTAKLATTFAFYIPFEEKGNWQYGFREIMASVAPIQDNYDQIIFETGHAQPHIFTLFYSKYDPVKYHQNLGSPDAVEKPRKNFDFGKYHFRKIYWPDDRHLKNTLFIGSSYSLPEKDIQTTPNAAILTDVYDEQQGFVARIVELKGAQLPVETY